MANEKRLIDANALIDWMTKPTGFRCNCDDCPDTDCLHCIVEDCIKNAPTVDAVEVVHGRWQWNVESHGDPMYGIDEDYGYCCSECKVWADEYGVDGDIYEEPPTHILHYCPNCGAKMDGDGNG